MKTLYESFLRWERFVREQGFSEDRRAVDIRVHEQRTAGSNAVIVQNLHIAR